MMDMPWDFPPPDPEAVKREKSRGKELRKSQWWKNRVSSGKCHYCGGDFNPRELTMDHVVPLSRGGKSTRSNLVPCCQKCNSDKKYLTPVEIVLRQLEDTDPQ